MFKSELIPAKMFRGLTASFTIAIILSLVIFLLNHPIKYVLYIFGLSLTGLLFLMAFRYDYKFRLPMHLPVKIIDYFFILCSVLVLVSNILGNPIVIINFILSVIVSFFLPGWVLLRLLQIDCVQRTNVGLLVLSFSISIGLSSLISMFALLFRTSTAGIFLSIIYVSISLLPLLKDRFYKFSEKRRQSFSRNHEGEHNLFDLLLLAWVSLFFIFVISSLYPQMAYVPGYDIVRHFSATKGLILAPDMYNSEYPWFHFTWMSLKELSAAPMWLFQSGVAYLSIFLIFSFYLMAKAYLSDVDRRAPLLATVFFSVFSGFGWLYFIKKVIDMPDISKHFDVISMAYNASYLDIGVGQSSWLWLWFRPITLGFTILFVLLYLMRREDLTKQKYIIISSLLILTLSQIHFSELVIFIVLLFVLALLFPTVKLRLKETSISILIGLAASVPLTIGYQSLLRSEHFLPWSSYGYLFVLAALAGLVFILVRYSRRPKVSLRTDSTLVTLIILSLYCISLFYWLSNADSSSIKAATDSTILAVPWEFYPTLLGLVSIIAIPGVILVVKKYRSHPIIIFTVLFILAIVFGRIITYVNASFEYTGYWERRFIPFVYVSCSLLAPIVVLSVIKQLKQQQEREVVRRLKGLKNVTTVGILSFLVLGGILSTFLSVEFGILGNQKYALTDNETKLQSSLNNADPYSTLLTVTERSRNIAEYANLGYNINYFRNQLWPSESPELPLNILSSLNSSAIIYLNKQDLEEITTNKNYENGYIASHLLKVAPVTKEGFGGEVLQTPRLTPPSSRSDMVLVLPESSDKLHNYYYAYDILSLGGYSYTTAPLSDIDSIRKAGIVVAPNEEIALRLMDYKREYGLQYKKLIVLNLDGYGHLVDIGSAQSSPSVVENNASSKWVPAAYGGFGKIGTPKITENPHSLKISVGAGKYKLWEVSRRLDRDKPLNLTKFDFVKFNWYGRNDGKWYVLQFSSVVDHQYFWYRFRDSWSGWKPVILPLKMPDGTGHILGVTFDKVTKLGSWSKIIKIDVRAEAATLNQGGEFYLDGFGFGNTFQSSSIKGTSNKKEIQFSTNIDLYPIIPKSSYDMVAYYNAGVPFLLHKVYNGYDMFYLNVNPIIQRLNSEGNGGRPIYPLLGKLLELVNAKLPVYEFMSRSRAVTSLVNGGVTAFNNATFIGNLTLKSSSAIMNIDAPTIKVNIDGKDSILNGVSKIMPINVENVTVKSDGGLINGGSGFYARVSLPNQPSTIHFIGHPAILSLSFKNGSTNTTIVGKKVQINFDKSNVLLRQPTVTSNGIINFGNFYGYGELEKTIRVLGQNLGTVGKVAFNSKYSDRFILANGTSLGGQFVRSEPVYAYNELGSLRSILSLPYIIPYLLTPLSLYLFFKIYLAKKKNKIACLYK
jgi:hypothetical protein